MGKAAENAARSFRACWGVHICGEKSRHIRVCLHVSVSVRSMSYRPCCEAVAAASLSWILKFGPYLFRTFFVELSPNKVSRTLGASSTQKDLGQPPHPPAEGTVGSRPGSSFVHSPDISECHQVVTEGAFLRALAQIGGEATMMHGARVSLRLLSPSASLY